MLVRQPGTTSFMQVTSNRPNKVQPVNALADRITALLADELAMSSVKQLCVHF